LESTRENRPADHEFGCNFIFLRFCAETGSCTFLSRRALNQAETASSIMEVNFWSIPANSALKLSTSGNAVAIETSCSYVWCAAQFYQKHLLGGSLRMILISQDRNSDFFAKTRN